MKSLGSLCVEEKEHEMELPWKKQTNKQPNQKAASNPLYHRVTELEKFFLSNRVNKDCFYIDRHPPNLA